MAGELCINICGYLVSCHVPREQRPLYKDVGATPDDLREAVTTLEDTARTARLVLGGSNPLAIDIENDLQNARAALRARETPSPPARSV